MPHSIRFSHRDALLVIDVQNDFCPGGALPIPRGDAVVPVINDWIRSAEDASAPIFFSRDWHPKAHPSFASQGGPWPAHCVQDTPGAAFHPDLLIPEAVDIITKGVRFDQDQYSVFDQTGFEHELKRRNLRRLIVGGLALDVCVKAGVLDALRMGFEIVLIPGGSQPVTEHGGREALDAMRSAGAELPA